MWRIVQHDVPDDFVLATGETHSVREFVELAFAHVGRDIEWQGEGLSEKGVDAKSGQILISVDPSHFRPTEVEELQGDASKAAEKLGWRHKTDFPTLVREMTDADIAAMKREPRHNGG